MKLFHCTYCGQLIYFENYKCESCGHLLGFQSEDLELAPLEDAGNGLFTLYGQGPRLFRYCANHQYNVCNWLVDAGADTQYCAACDLNHTIPDLGKPEYQAYWADIEKAKHRLIYSLLRLKLPVFSKKINQDTGLQFEFIAEENNQKVYTGHDNGVITINIAEADDIQREQARRAMNELYRTLLGHFRHEVGHYYWDRLIDGTANLEEYRKLFGNEQADYGEAVKKHYAEGAPIDWQKSFISSYATTHPWEDWAETWAHYLHIIDTLETAYAFGISIKPGLQTSGAYEASINRNPFAIQDFHDIFSLWLPISFMMNSMNRSMGLPDSYPFVVPPPVIEKLAFIHKVVTSTNRNM
jgi:hypothetical protein